MTVAALILADPHSAEDPGALVTLTRLIEAAWSGGAQPILVAGLSAAVDLAPLARSSSATDTSSAAREAAKLVGGTSGLLILPIAHAGIDPETITALIAVHGRAPGRSLAAARDGVAGPLQLLPIANAIRGTEEALMLVECGDEAAILPSDGRARLAYEGPPADTDAVDPWERRGGEEG